MERKILAYAAMICSLLIVFRVGSAWAQDSVGTADTNSLAVMSVDVATLLKWQEERQNAPKAPIDEGIAKMLSDTLGTYPTSINLMSYSPWNSSNMSLRAQEACGNCWIWSSTALMEIAHTVNNNVNDTLSVELADSCHSSCAGGNIYGVVDFYSQLGYTVPWSNTNAAFADGDGTLNVPCGSIASFPNYAISLGSFHAYNVETHNVGQETAIANIKNILQQNMAVTFGITWANDSDVDNFRAYWHNAESVLWDPDDYCGETVTHSQSHQVLVVGYDDSDPDPSNWYWIVLNSWGNDPIYASDGTTVTGYNRPNGIFRMPLYMNYDCYMNGTDSHGNPTQISLRDFDTANILFTGGQDNNLPPSASTAYPTSIGQTSATLSGMVNPNGALTEYQFEIGTTKAYGSLTPVGSAGSGKNGVQVSATINGISPSQTQYNYRLLATSNNGIVTSWNMSFPNIPIVTATPATNIKPTTATLNGTINTQGGNTLYLFEWGLDTSYASGAMGTTLPASLNTVPVSVNITGLTTDTTYHYRLATNNSGGESDSSDMTFTTTGIPIVTYLEVTSITTTSATVIGTVNPNGVATNAVIKYGPTTSYGNTGSWSNIVGAQFIMANLSGLIPNQTYHYCIMATNSNGSSPCADMTFTTLGAPPIVATTNATNITSTTATLNGTVNPNNAATSYDFQYGTSTAYGNDTVAGSAGSGTSALNVNAAISNLTPSTTYHFTIGASNNSGGVDGVDRTFTTLSMPYSMAGNIYADNYDIGPWLAGATVSIAGKSATTDTTGSFSLTNVPSGTHKLTISKTGYTTYTNSSYTITGNQSGLRFALTPLAGTTHSVSGTVWTGNGTVNIGTITGPVISGAIVSVADLAKPTDSVGNFNITEVPAGTYVLRVSKTGYITYTDSRFVVRGGNQSGVLLFLTAVTFTVTTSAGKGGNMSPSTPQTVNYNSTISFTVTPFEGFEIRSVQGCGGSLIGHTYTTGPITANCSVSATFSVQEVP
ncbi:MAG: carboxypeptidase regulatory-like domain-containing protein [Dissulfurispiraceae bacterium]